MARLMNLATALTLVLVLAPPARAVTTDFVLHDYLVYRDRVQDLQGGARLDLGRWDHHDSGGSWIGVPRVINGSVQGPGSVILGPFNGLNDDPSWTRVHLSGSFTQVDLRGAEDDGRRRGQPGSPGAWQVLGGESIPASLRDQQYLWLRVQLGQGDALTQIDLTLQRDLRDAHPRLLVDDLAELRARCTGPLSHACEMNRALAGSGRLTEDLSGYSDSHLATVAKVMAFAYLVDGGDAQAQRARQILLRLASHDRQHWVDLRSSIQDLGLGWIGLSWMLALDWVWGSFDRNDAQDRADLQTIADGSAVFVDYLLEMYKHTDFNNHFYLGRSPVLLAGLLLKGQGLRDADANRYIEQGFDFLYNHEHPALNSVAGDMGGWHESLGYFDGEMGYPVVVDMDALRGATGLDFFADSSFWRRLPFWYLQSTVNHDGSLIHWADQGKDRWSRALDGSVSEGKNTRSYLAALHKNLTRLGYPEAELAQELLDRHIGVYYDSGNYAESYYKSSHLNDVLWYQPGAASRALANEPSTAHFAALGEVILRQGTGADDAMAMFACARFRGGHQQADNGHFSIWYRGYLAVDSGYYDHWGSDHHMNYARRSVAHNTLTVTLPGETFTNTAHNDGGQKLSCNTTYYNSPVEDPDCLACAMQVSSDLGAGYDVIQADLTASYDAAKVDEVRRVFVWLRPDRFVVFDRVVADDAAYAKRFLLHAASAFVQDGVWRRAEDGQGRLWVQTLLPADAQLAQVGGSGHEWEVGGVNYPPASGVEFAGTHRLEVSPGAARTTDHFLHLLSLGDTGAAAPAPAALVEAGTASGLVSGTWELLFAHQPPLINLSFELPAAVSTVLLVGVSPSTAHDVAINGTTLTRMSDAQGVLLIEDSSGSPRSVVLGQGTCPDADGDGYLDMACGGQDCDDADDQVFAGQGCEPDAGGLGSDAATISDAGAISSEAGTQRDATTQDRAEGDGGPEDRGAGDAAIMTGVDAAVSAHGDAHPSQPVVGDGCACTTARGGPTSAWAALLLLLVSMGRRRQATSPRRSRPSFHD